MLSASGKNKPRVVYQNFIFAEGVLVATRDGGVLVVEVQPAGRKRMQARDWINGRGGERGQCFE